MTGRLEGKKIAFLATDGFEEIELTAPWDAIKSEGAEVELISLRNGTIQGMNHDEKADTFSVDQAIDEAEPEKYDGLVLPGGVANPDKLRIDEKAVAFVKAFFDQSKPVAAICHGPWVLIETGEVNGKTLTSWPSLKTDIINAGGDWVDKEVCVDHGLITSRKPDDLSAFCEKTIIEFAEGTSRDPMPSSVIA